MYLLTISLSFISAVLTGLFGNFLGGQQSVRLAVFCLFLSLICSIFIFVEVALYKSPVYIELFYWVNSEVFDVKWSFMFDSLTVTMTVIVCFISFLVHLYSIEYMSADPHISRFFSYLSLFTFFMLMLITADNFIQLFLGWEGVGLCSYLLINFWFTRIQANKAAIKAMIINRIGDFSLIIGILFIFVYFKSVDYSSIAVLIPFFSETTLFSFKVLDIIGLFLFIGAVGKSAQLGLHTWLPDAMEGPTPVSALIHAATMVTAGVFLITRVSFLYEYSLRVLEIITLIGVLTSFLASTTGLLQNDLKKVIAYSTCSQLGYMVFCCGLSHYFLGIFHLTNHAFFKALLFLSAGSVIHAVNDEQDMRKMGGLRYFLPLTYVMMLVGSLALIGFPFLTGFYSKDLILEMSYAKFSYLGYFSYIFGTLGAFCTSFYSTRLLFLTFLSKPNGYKKIIAYSADSGIIIRSVLSCLFVPSVFVGYYTKDLMVGPGTSMFFNSIFIDQNNFAIFDAEFIPTIFKILPVILSLSGVAMGILLYFFGSNFLIKLKISKLGKFAYNFLNRKWYFDKIYNDYFAQFFFKSGYTLSYKFLDRGIFEMIGPTGLAYSALNFSGSIHNLQTKSLYHINLSILLGALLALFIDSSFFFLFENNLKIVLLNLLMFIFFIF